MEQRNVTLISGIRTGAKGRMFGKTTLPRRAFASVGFLVLLAACPTPDRGGEERDDTGSAEKSEWVPPALDEIKGEEYAKLTSPPEVPPPITRRHPTRVVVKLEVRELVKPIAGGVDYTFWTFGGTVPGSFIRIRRGDLVEFHLANHPDNKVPHNIDLHAVTGPGGGAASSFTPPGHETTFSFQALNPGLYVYHCATAPVGMHIANGMYGLILVEPEAGLPKVDREFYVMQGDFYTAGEYGEPGLQPFDMQKALAEEADYVLFNGEVGALLNDNALKAEVGETIRLFVGNGGPNLISSFHVIGEIFDRVHDEAGSSVNRNVQTTLIPAGGAAIAELKADVPGELILVDHAIFRAFNKGALGAIDVSGGENQTAYSGKQDQQVYLPEGGSAQSMPNSDRPKQKVLTGAGLASRGRVVYDANCAACHLPDGQGIPGSFPPVRKSDFLNADVKRAIRAVGTGLSGEITVNGVKYNNVMPKLNLTHQDIAAVLTYLYQEMDNEARTVTVDQVSKALSTP